MNDAFLTLTRSPSHPRSARIWFAFAAVVFVSWCVLVATSRPVLLQTWMDELHRGGFPSSATALAELWMLSTGLIAWMMCVGITYPPVCGQSPKGYWVQAWRSSFATRPLTWVSIAYIVIVLAAFAVPANTWALFFERPGSVLLEAMLGALSIACAEEILFRGLLFPTLRVFLSPVLAVVADGLVFGLAHLDRVHDFGSHLAILNAIAVTGTGCVYAALYYRTRSLIPSILLHTLADTSWALYVTPGHLNRWHLDLKAVTGSLLVDGLIVCVLLLLNPQWCASKFSSWIRS